MRLIALVLTVLMISGCRMIIPKTLRQSQKIELGMSRKQVIESIGEPYRNAVRKSEECGVEEKLIYRVDQADGSILGGADFFVTVCNGNVIAYGQRADFPD